MSLPPLEWFSKGAEYVFDYSRRPKLDIQVVPSAIGTKNQVVHPMSPADTEMWEYYFRVTNLGRTEARQCTARLRLPDLPPEFKDKMPTLLVDTIHKVRNPLLDWFEPDIRHVGTSAQDFKKLGKSANLSPDPERPFYAGTIQVCKMQDGSGRPQVLITTENGGPMVSSISMDAIKIHRLTVIVNYVWGKEFRKQESRSYILDTNSFKNVAFDGDLSH